MSRKTTVMVSSTLKTIAIMTMVTSVLWTALGVYNALKAPVETEVPPEILAPVNPSIDMDIINSLTERRQLTDEYNSEDVVREALKVLVVEPVQQNIEEVSEPAVDDQSTITPESVPATEESTPTESL